MKGKKLAYKVDKIQTILPDQVDTLKIQNGRDLVTLMTCTPYMVNSHRLLVTGHRVPYPKKATPEIKQLAKKQSNGVLKWVALIVLGLVAATLIWCAWYRRRKGKKAAAKRSK